MVEKTINIGMKNCAFCQNTRRLIRQAVQPLQKILPVRSQPTKDLEKFKDKK